MALPQKIALTMRFMEMFADCWIFCVQQHVEKGVELCSRHNLHRTDHMKNGTQRIAD